MQDDWMTVGRIVSAQGMQGEVRVYPESDFPERFLEPGDRWLLRPNTTEPEQVQLLSGRYVPKKNLYVIRLAGVVDRDQAEALRDTALVVPVSDRPDLDPGEFHILDLIGLRVIDQTLGEAIGVVVDVLSAGNDLLEVAIDAGSPEVSDLPEGSDLRPRVLIPFVYAIVPVVDLKAQCIEIIPPPGLLDLQTGSQAHQAQQAQAKQTQKKARRRRSRGAVAPTPAQGGAQTSTATPVGQDAPDAPNS